MVKFGNFPTQLKNHTGHYALTFLLRCENRAYHWIKLNHQWIDEAVCIINDNDYERNTLSQSVTR